MLDRDDIYLNSKEVAQILDVSPDTVNEFARKHCCPRSSREGSGGSVSGDIASFKRQLRGTTAACHGTSIETGSTVSRPKESSHDPFVS